ncbi:hypothetical protein DSO57_1017644 [Entomophthora muscae]|uniref:Uncharacterized protein n=1 Tax=Entomophthora muscae TaxID=34485 RepID=A0ACC2TRR6_9FUNG|nr:hypothetical protein DSO57_1017644 [Entomophthora muscae]
MIFACKKCKKVFRKDTTDFDKSDEFCPRCDNHFVLPARTLDSEYTHYEPKIDPRVDTSHLFDKRIKQPSLEEQLKDFDFSELLD